MQAAIVSIHDVTPSTLTETGELLRLCKAHGVHKTTLLVVPGLQWSRPLLNQLREWQRCGHEIAAHGWLHQCGQISSWYHRGHSLVLSRQAAEHLSLAGTSIFDLMQRAATWFDENFACVPSLYVPPAWALGNIALDRIRETRFQQVETLTSLFDVRRSRSVRLPLLGFEADTLARQCLLQCSNALNLALSNRTGRAIRIAIHPFDHRLRLARQLASALQQTEKTLLYSEISP
jgi:uncharacterized protein